MWFLFKKKKKRHTEILDSIFYFIKEIWKHLDIALTKRHGCIQANVLSRELDPEVKLKFKHDVCTREPRK